MRFPLQIAEAAGTFEWAAWFNIERADWAIDGVTALEAEESSFCQMDRPERPYRAELAPESGPPW